MLYTDIRTAAEHRVRVPGRPGGGAWVEVVHDKDGEDRAHAYWEERASDEVAPDNTVTVVTTVRRR